MSNTEPGGQTSANNITEPFRTTTNTVQEMTDSLEAYIVRLNNISPIVVAEEIEEINNNLSEMETAFQTTSVSGEGLLSVFKGLSSVFTGLFNPAEFNEYFQNAIENLKEIDSILTDISKTSNLSSSQIKNLEDHSYQTASKYGKKASDYLSGVQDMAGAGYNNSTEMAELSMLAQSAGNLDASLANEYLIATDSAYEFQGNIQKLNQVLDGQNAIAHKNALSLAELAEATKLVASQSAESGVAIEKTTAAMATMMSVTGEDADSVADAWNTILENFQQVSKNTKGLTEYENACQALGVSLKTVKNGVIQLREPMAVLSDLSKAYTALGDNDERKINLLNSVGDENAGNQLGSLLENWNTYTKMLTEYSYSSGSAMQDAMKSTESWEGSLNRLSNTWTATVHNVVKSDDMTILIDIFNKLLGLTEKLTESLGVFGSIGLGAGLTSFVKNFA
ncbi:MAG: phage tail tape measure protein [Lachnospiraceae bacterium]|nr:phage tail tape measure protein [Lachnospiraceae bacterium]